MNFELNGQACHYQGKPDTWLLDALREELNLKGSRFGCGQEQCGACHVLIDGRSLASCQRSMASIAGAKVVSVEGLTELAVGKALAQAFIQEQAAQCGYCSAGILVSAAALLLSSQEITDASVRSALDAHLCRCGAHPRIIRAVFVAARQLGRCS